MRNVLGIDLGGTKIAAGIVNENGEILEHKIINTRAKDGKDAVLNNIVSLIEKLSNEKTVGVGITSPGFVNTDTGFISFAGNISGWSGINLKEEILKLKYIKNLVVENDANMALLAEVWEGSAKGFDSSVMLTLGTGLGGGLYIKNTGIILGSNFKAGELGHTILYPNGRECNCGQKGCAERYIAGTALATNYNEITGKDLCSKEVIELIDRDLNAAKALDKMISDLAIFITTISNFIDPELVVLGGGFTDSKDIWWEKLIDYYRKYSNSKDKPILKLLNLKILLDL